MVLRAGRVPSGGHRRLGAEQDPIVPRMFPRELQVRVATAAERVIRVARGSLGLGQEPVELAEPFLENGRDEALLVLEVTVDGGWRNPGSSCHGPDGESFRVAELGKERGGGID